MLLFVLTMIVVLSSITFAQVATADGDSTSFDFWLGDWSLTWRDRDSNIAHGENSITKTLGGRVLQERFKAQSGAMTGYEGMSLSLFDVTAKRWFQTWVDSDGNYLDFSGGTMGEKRFFGRAYREQDGDTVQQRMIFYNITRDAFDWDWQRSLDGGTTWELRWQIHYERKNQKK